MSLLYSFLRKRLACVCLVVALLIALEVWARPIQIEYWREYKQEGATRASYLAEEELIAEFNRLNEGRIKVFGVVVPGGIDNKLPMAVAGGAPPQVIMIDRFRTGSYAAWELIQPIDDLIAKYHYDVEGHYSATYYETVFQGKTYAIPWNTDSRALYFNTTLFEEAGLDPKTPPTTWEEVDQLCSKLDRWNASGELVQVGFVPHWGNWYFMGWLLAAGGEILDESGRQVTWNSPEGVEALSWMRERLDRIGGAGVLYTYIHHSDWAAWLNGQVAMMIQTQDALEASKGTTVDQSFAIANPPRPERLKDEPLTWSGGLAFAIPTGVRDDEREAAWEFIRFLADHSAQANFGSSTGLIPSLWSAATSPDFLGVDPHIDRFVELMPYSEFRPVSPAGKEMWSYYTGNVHSMLIEGKMSVAQILEETARLAQIDLDAIWEEIERE